MLIYSIGNFINFCLRNLKQNNILICKENITKEYPLFLRYGRFILKKFTETENSMYKIILASGSPRRKEILEQVGIKFSVCVSKEEERITKSEPEEIVKDLATVKARAVARITDEKAIIIGADTMVAVDGQVLGKPKNESEAREMIFRLQGNRHQVYTGVCAIIKEEGKQRKENLKEIIFAERSDVWVYPLTESQINDYIATGEPFDKAGGYGIQGKFAIHIEKIEGDYYNIVGFPVARLYRKLLEEGVDLLMCQD
jgi:septum formation protein